MPAAGRKDYEDMMNVTWPTTLSENIVAQLKERKEQTGVSVAAQIRRAIERDLKGGIDTQAVMDEALRLWRGPYLANVPCGDWEAAIELAEDFVLSEDVKNEFDALDGDVIVRTQGQSMEGAMIPDDALVLCRPVDSKKPPRKGDATVVQIITDTGEYYGTLKTWMAHGEPPELQDGNGKPFPYPDGTTDVIPVAVVKGVIWRYS